MASPERVWRALTEPSEVSAWDGVEPLSVPGGYPLAGQRARWRTRVGPIPLVLHDRVTAVETGRRLASVIDVGFVHVEEEYRLAPGPSGTVLVSDNVVRSRVRGLDTLAVWTARRAIEASMRRLRLHCEAEA